jgi:ABC-2 type transport system permease protein
MTRALHAEWTKLRTVPSTAWTALSLVVATVAVGAFATFGLGTVEGADTVRFSASGVLLGQVAAVVLAVLTVTPEYETAMIRTTLAADPHRGRVLAAKAATVTAVVLGCGTLGMLGSLAAGRLILPDQGLPAPSLVDGPTLRAYSGTVLYFGLIALLSIGLAMVIRHTGSSITVVLSVLYVLPVAATLVTDPVWRERILKYSPMTAGLAIQNTLNVDALPMKPWPGLGVLAGYAGVAVVAGAVLFRSRDA